MDLWLTITGHALVVAFELSVARCPPVQRSNIQLSVCYTQTIYKILPHFVGFDASIEMHFVLCNSHSHPMYFVFKLL